MNRTLQTTLLGFAVFAYTGGSLLAACTEDETGTIASIDAAPPDTTGADAGDGAPAQAAVSIEVSVTYNGSQKGPLLASAWPSATPGLGAPGGTGSNETAAWPGTNVVNLRNVKPGKYFVFAYIMTGAPHRTGPTGADPVGPPVQVEVMEGKTTTVNATLFDPAPDGGADATTDGGDGG